MVHSFIHCLVRMIHRRQKKERLYNIYSSSSFWDRVIQAHLKKVRSGHHTLQPRRWNSSTLIWLHERVNIYLHEHQTITPKTNTSKETPVVPPVHSACTRAAFPAMYWQYKLGWYILRSIYLPLFSRLWWACVRVLLFSRSASLSLSLRLRLSLYFVVCFLPLTAVCFHLHGLCPGYICMHACASNWMWHQKKKNGLAGGRAAGRHTTPHHKNPKIVLQHINSLAPISPQNAMLN